jgi:hypothetical protein
MEQIHPGFGKITDPRLANLIQESEFEKHAGPMGRQLNNVGRAMELVGGAWRSSINTSNPALEGYTTRRDAGGTYRVPNSWGADTIGKMPGVPVGGPVSDRTGQGPTYLPKVPDYSGALDSKHEVSVEFGNAPAGMKVGLRRAEGPADFGVRIHSAMGGI